LLIVDDFNTSEDRKLLRKVDLRYAAEIERVYFESLIIVTAAKPTPHLHSVVSPIISRPVSKFLFIETRIF